MTGDMLINYALGILFFPLISFIILIFVGKRLPRQGDIVGNGTTVSYTHLTLPTTPYV